MERRKWSEDGRILQLDTYRRCAEPVYVDRPVEESHFFERLFGDDCLLEPDVPNFHIVVVAGFHWQPVVVAMRKLFAFHCAVTADTVQCVLIDPLIPSDGCRRKSRTYPDPTDVFSPKPDHIFIIPAPRDYIFIIPAPKGRLLNLIGKHWGELLSFISEMRHTGQELGVERTLVLIWAETLQAVDVRVRSAATFCLFPPFPKAGMQKRWVRRFLGSQRMETLSKLEEPGESAFPVGFVGNKTFGVADLTCNKKVDSSQT